MIMCVLLCYPVSIHMSQLQATGRPISSYFSDNGDTGQLSPGTTWSWVLIGSLEVSFRASLSPQQG